MDPKTGRSLKNSLGVGNYMSFFSEAGQFFLLGSSNAEIFGWPSGILPRGLSKF